MNKLHRSAIAILFLTICSIKLVSAQAGRSLQLVANETINKTISSEESHSYTVELENGMAIIGKFTQDGIDLAIDVYAPDGELYKQIDIPNGTARDELIDITSNQSGEYEFMVHPLNKEANTGNYTFKVMQILSLSENTKRITKNELPTETLYNLWESSLTDNTAIDKFIENQPERHIIESIEGSNTDMLVTYFCIPNDNTE